MIDFKALQKPFAKREVKTKTTRYKDKKTGEQKQFSVSYITARQVMNRLDEICGPANWRDEYLPTESGVMCTLFLLCDGEWVGKSDIGTESDIAPEKGAFAIAFKRAAVKWGVGRELYDDGVADLDGTGGEVQQTARDDDHVKDDGYPVTIGTLWPNVAKSLLDKKMDELADTNANVGAIIYPVATTQLGYADDSEVKHALGLDSIMEFHGALEELMVLVMQSAPGEF